MEPGAQGESGVRNVLSDVIGSVAQVGTVNGNLIQQYQSPEIPVPQQVPVPPRRFVNRVRELAELDALAGSDGVWIGVVSGLTGVGKSATVRQWAAASAKHFPDGQLYVDYAALRTEDGTAVGDALADCLRVLGVTPENIPPSSASRAGLFRTRTAGKRCLIVLDDVTQPAQVLPFIPNSPGSAVLVTSNDRLVDLTLDGADLVTIDPLDAAGGVRMLHDICGERRVLAESDSAAELVRLCAGLPIALQIAAARLVARPRLRIEALVRELADENNRLGALTLRGERRVSAVFDNVYRDLSPEAAAVYRRLGLVPGHDISIEVAALAAGTAVDDVRDALDVLIDAHLLGEIGADRFRFHDLVRLHARDCAKRDEPSGRDEDVLRDVSRHFLARAAFADQAMMGPRRLRIAAPDLLTGGAANPFGSAAEATTWLVAERANVLHVLRAMAERGWDEQVWQLAEALVPFYLNRRDLADWIEASDLGAAAARRAGNADAEARLRSVVSRAYTDLGELDRAGEELAIARTLVEHSDNLVLVASVWEFTGRYLDRVDPTAAVDAYRRSIELNAAADEPRGVALATYFLGCALDAAGDHDHALRVLVEAHESLTALNDTRMAGRALIGLASARFGLGDTDAAQMDLRAAVEVFDHSGATHYEAEARHLLADILEHTGDMDGARTQLSRVLEIHQAGGADTSGLAARLDLLTPRAQ